MTTPDDKSGLILRGSGSLSRLTKSSALAARGRKQIAELIREIPLVITNSIGMELRLIKAGTFQMGATKSADRLTSFCQELKPIRMVLRQKSMLCWDALKKWQKPDSLVRR